MKRHNDLVSRLFPGITLTLALAGAGCGVAVETQGPVDGVRPELPDLRPDLSEYVPDADGIARFRAATGVLRQSMPRGTAEGGNADGVYSCIVNSSYPGYDHYEHGGNVDDTQLHVIGMYEPAAVDSRPDKPVVSGPVDVQVNRRGRSVLVLSSYTSVEWNVTVAEGASLELVIASGLDSQTVNAPEGVRVLRYSYEEDGEYLGDFGYNWPSFYSTDLVDAAEILTGLELTSFRGCYKGESFQIDEPGELRPPHPVSPSPDPGIIAGCEALTAESSYCMATTRQDHELTMVGLDSGTTCGSVVTNLDFTSFAEASLGWVGDYLYTCWHDRGLARISIADGSVDIAPLPCSGVTAHDGELLVQVRYEEFLDTPYYLARFASFDDVVARNPEWVYEMAPYHGSMATQGDRLYMASIYDDAVAAVDLTDGAEFQTIPLEGFYDWVFGMSVTDDGKIVIGGETTKGGLHIFDAQSGASLGTLPSEFDTTPIAGIACVSGGAAE